MDMSMVTVSSKYQVVIPKQVREKANIKPGTKLQMVEVNGIIQMVPVIPILEMRGYFKGHEIEYAREKRRSGNNKNCSAAKARTSPSVDGNHCIGNGQYIY